MSFDLRVSQGTLVIKETAGDLSTVSDVDKLIQDIHKIVSTPLGANRFFPWYGFNAIAVVGSLLDFTFRATMAESQIRSALQTLQKIQSEQEKNQVLSPQEQLAAIRTVIVNENSLDPRFLQAMISIANKALQTTDTVVNVE